MSAWLMRVLGLDDGAGPFYAFWSGSGSDIQELAVLSLPFMLWRALNCHAARCWRIGIHHVAGQRYRVCRRHHNEVTGYPRRKLTTAYLREQHQAHVRAQARGEVTGE